MARNWNLQWAVCTTTLGQLSARSSRLIPFPKTLSLTFLTFSSTLLSVCHTSLPVPPLLTDAKPENDLVLSYNNAATFNVKCATDENRANSSCLVYLSLRLSLIAVPLTCSTLFYKLVTSFSIPATTTTTTTTATAQHTRITFSSICCWNWEV